LFHVHSRESLDELWSHYLLLLDHIQLALEARLARLVAGDASNLSKEQTNNSAGMRFQSALLTVPALERCTFVIMRA
jgi:hypothetical protein